MSAQHAAPCRQRGMTTMEIALVLPILLLIVCGIIETANMLRIQVTMNSAITALAREVAVDPTVRTQTTAEAYMFSHNLIPMVQQELANNVTANAPVLTLAPENPTCTSASCDPFNVGLNYSYVAITPLMQPFFDGVILSASATKTAEPTTANTTASQ